MKSFPCPACGASIAFHSPVSVQAVCTHCQSVVVRRDVNIETIGTMAALPEDMSPLHIGSQGVFGSTQFTIIGRAKMAWAHGYWNEWFLWCDDGRRGWLAEAQGSFAFSFELEEPWPADIKRVVADLKKQVEPKKLLVANQASLSHIQVGHLFRFHGVALQLMDVKVARCLGSEGELPFAAARGRSAVALDFSGDDGGFACIEYSFDTARVFIGEYMEWDELKIDGVRELEGWT
ncbi:MAG: DUF4178 domain-containing protein [Gammaproteobacteria bacterium]|nr:DUF4178 domain-containing protein [Gammaproteobacteria bacterium]